MKYIAVFWIVFGLALEGAIYYGYREYDTCGYVMYGGRGKNAKIAYEDTQPEIYNKRIEDMKDGLWQAPLGWLVLTPFFLRRMRNELNKRSKS